KQREFEEQIGIAGERYRNQLEIEANRRLDQITASGKGLPEAMTAYRLFVSFSHDLAEATGRRIYEVHKAFAERLHSESLRGHYLAMNRAALPPVEMPAAAKRILEAIRERVPRPARTIFEGEDEWQRYLAGNDLTEARGTPAESAFERWQRSGGDL